MLNPTSAVRVSASDITEDSSPAVFGKGARRPKSAIWKSGEFYDIFTDAEKYLIETFAASSATILLCGKSGTGKEVVASLVHKLSYRRDKPFIAINCAAIPKDLMEAELFGYVKGAFTGAYGNKMGKFRGAHGGTLFLDEIAELPIEVQGKMLRAIQEKIVTPLGSNDDIKIDTRIIAATNVNLPYAILRRRFREDLFYRLNVLTLTLKPFSELTPEQKIGMAEFLLKDIARQASIERQVSVPVKTLSPEARQVVLMNGWRGNVRELRSALECGHRLSSGNVIGVVDLQLLQRGLLEGSDVLYGLLANEFLSRDHGIKFTPNLAAFSDRITKEVEMTVFQLLGEAIGFDAGLIEATLDIPEGALLQRMLELGIISEPWKHAEGVPVEMRRAAELGILRNRIETTGANAEHLMKASGKSFQVLMNERLQSEAARLLEEKPEERLIAAIDERATRLKQEFQKAAYEQLLDVHGNNIASVARACGLKNSKTLSLKYRDLGISSIERRNKGQDAEASELDVLQNSSEKITTQPDLKPLSKSFEEATRNMVGIQASRLIGESPPEGLIGLIDDHAELLKTAFQKAVYERLLADHGNNVKSVARAYGITESYKLLASRYRDLGISSIEKRAVGSEEYQPDQEPV